MKFSELKASRLPLAVFCLALLPRLADLGSRPFWYDEIITEQRSSLPLPGLIRDAFVYHQTPVYFLLVAPLAHLSDPQFWLRLPSAILGALCVVLVFSIAARAGGLTAGIAAALIIGLAPTEIAYSQEARSYMLMIFFLLVALHGLTALAQSGERAALPWRAGGLGWRWLQFIAGSTAALCTLGDSLPWWAAAGVSATVMIFRARNRSGLLRNFLLANAICLACCAPLYVTMLHLEVSTVGRALAFVPAATRALIWYDIGSIYLMRICDSVSAHFMAVPTPQALTVCIGAGLGLAALAGIWRLRRAPMMAAVLLPAVFSLPVLFGIASIWKPMLMARYLLWSGPNFAILAGTGVGAGLDKCRPSTRYGVLAAASLLLLVNLLPFYRAETKPRWDIAAGIFAAQAKPQDVAYFYEDGAGTTMRYYLPVQLRPYLLLDFYGNLQHAEQEHEQGKRVWAVYGDAWSTKHWTSLAAFKATLAPLGTPSAEFHAGSRITMWLYDSEGK